VARLNAEEKACALRLARHHVDDARYHLEAASKEAAKMLEAVHSERSDREWRAVDALVNAYYHIGAVAASKMWTTGRDREAIENELLDVEARIEKLRRRIDRGS
jgi:hypothetical protein